jgi:hypothetical protein
MNDATLKQMAAYWPGSTNTVNGFSSADDAHAAKNVGKINATNGATRMGRDDL